MAQGNGVMQTLMRMNEGTDQASGLDPQTYMLVRIAALAASGAPPVSYLVNIGVAEELGVKPEQVEGVLVAIAPVIGGARVAAATSAIVKSLGLAIEIAEELEEEAGA